MTTILADAKAGVMVSDSMLTDGDRAWSTRKVKRVRGALVGQAGVVSKFDAFLAWYRDGAENEPEFDYEDCSALVLKDGKLWFFDSNAAALQPVESGREAIGSGAKFAIAAYDALGWTDPRKAVQIACRHDPGSRAPIRVYHAGRDLRGQ